MLDGSKVKTAPQEWLDEYKTFPKSVQTMQDFYIWTDKKHGSKPYMGTFREDMSIEWKTRHEVHLMALSVGTCLVQHGIPPGSRIGVYSENRLEAAVFLEAAQIYGYIIIFSFDAAIYSYPGFVYHDSECSAIYVSKNKLNSIEKLTLNELISLQFIIVSEMPDLENEDFECLKDIKIHLLSEFIGLTEGFAAPPEILPTTINTICYSSGTAGAPKGIVLSHRAILYSTYNVACAIDINTTTVHLSFLPIAHILERLTLSSYTYRGAKIVFARKGVASCFEDMVACKESGGPHIPAIIEKMYQSIKSKVPSFLLNTCLGVHKFFSFFGFRSRLSDLLLFNKIQKKFGGHLEWFVIAGDAFSKETHIAMSAILNIDIIPIYGMSECGGSISICDRRNIRPGTCGCLAPGFELKFGERKEIFLRCPTMFDGYWHNPEITSEAFVDGWLRSGDKGGYDKYGNLIVTGRAYNMFEFKPGRELAIPFICFIYRQCQFCDDIYLTYFEEGCSFLAIVVVPKNIVLYALSLKEEDVSSDEEYEKKANSKAFIDWGRKYLRQHARNYDIGDIPFIGALRCTVKPFDKYRSLLTETGKQRPHMFTQYFGSQIEEMKKEVMERRHRKHIESKDVIEYSKEEDEEDDDEENNQEDSNKGNVQ